MDSEKIQELRKWLEEHKITVLRLNREFSDCMAFAKFMKQLFPKLVDLHNYSPNASTQRKLANWEAMNYKVLSKLGLHKKKSVLEDLASSTPGAVEQLLYEVMMVYKKSKQKNQPTPLEQVWLKNEEVLMINVTKNIGDALIKVPQKMILYSIYEKERVESQAKDAQIESDKQKIAHLEQLIELKKDRIEELSGQLDILSKRGSGDHLKLLQFSSSLSID